MIMCIKKFYITIFQLHNNISNNSIFIMIYFLLKAIIVLSDSAVYRYLCTLVNLILVTCSLFNRYKKNKNITVS